MKKTIIVIAASLLINLANISENDVNDLSNLKEDLNKQHEQDLKAIDYLIEYVENEGIENESHIARHYMYQLNMFEEMK